MGNTLETRAQGQEGSHGRGRCMVRSDWRFEYCASSLAICRSRGTEETTRDELGGGRMGGNGAQDGAVDREDEKSDTDTNALEPCCIGDRSSMGFCIESCRSPDLLICRELFFQLGHFHCRSAGAVQCIYHNVVPSARKKGVFQRFDNVTFLYQGFKWWE